MCKGFKKKAARGIKKMRFVPREKGACVPVMRDQIEINKKKQARQRRKKRQILRKPQVGLQVRLA